MNLIIHGHHLEVTPALRDYVQGKLVRVRRHFDHVIEANVLLSVEKLSQKAEISLKVSGNHIHVESIEPDMYAAIDSLMDKLDRQVLRHKDRLKDRSPHEAIKRQQAAQQQ
ncbi:MAG: hypothetical protein RL669_1950 [Pseudomonadota bacterium]|jgi:putative sigma-54 modulation protein